MKTLFAMACCGTMLAAAPAKAAITLTTEVVGGTDLSNIRVGDTFTLAFRASGGAADTLPSYYASIYRSSNLSETFAGYSSSAFDPLTTNPEVFRWTFTANSVGEAYVTGRLLTVDPGPKPGAEFVVGTPLLLTVQAALPEPGSWALMIGGVGIMGGALRVQRRRVALAA